jgi:nucleoside-diphosphate-sugar epimerase
LSPPRPLRVLVTGAGGLIGGAVCAGLLTRGHGVVALVHRNGGITDNDRSVLPVDAWMGGPPALGRIGTVAGDVSRPALGLDPATAFNLACGIDVIIHAAGVTSFGLAQDIYDAVNVAGAGNVAAFALCAGAHAPGLVHVSTAYVCGARSGVIPETLTPCEPPFTNAYEASKAAGEREVTLRRRRGLKVAIARPSIVVGDSATGAVRRFDHFYGLMKLVAEGRIPVLPATPGATLDLAPIDHVVGGLVDIAERMAQADGQVFHLASAQPTPLSALADLSGDYLDLQPPRFVDPEAFDPAALAPSEQRAFRRVGEAYAGYLRHDPRFAVSNLQVLSGRVCPPLGSRYLRRLIDYAIAAGHVRRPAAANGRRDSSGPAVS